MFGKTQRKLRKRLAKFALSVSKNPKSNTDSDIGSSTSNSFLATIAEYEQTQSARAESRLSSHSIDQSDHSNNSDAALAEVVDKPVSAAENARIVADSFVTAVNNSKTYTIGFVTLGSTKHSDFAGYEIVRRLAQETQRQSTYISTYRSRSIFRSCIQTLEFEVYGKRADVTAASDVVIDNRITLDSWRGEGTPPNTFTMIQKSIVELPNLKRRFRIIALDLGKADSPIAAPIGRLCDTVTLLVPSFQTIKPHDASRMVAQFESAGVKFAGAIALEAAA